MGRVIFFNKYKTGRVISYIKGYALLLRIATLKFQLKYANYFIVYFRK
jgi:hypothetical protein